MQHVIGAIGLALLTWFGFALTHDGCGCTVFSYEQSTRPTGRSFEPERPPYCDDPVKMMMESLAYGIESGGDYHALGPIGYKTGEDGEKIVVRALGKYQIMNIYVDDWSKEILGRKVKKREFFDSPALQDQIAYGKLAQYWKMHDGDVLHVASRWFTGQPYSASTANRTDGMTKNRDYVQIVSQYFEGLQATCANDWACPADQTLVTSMFGPRWGKTHEGIDIEGDPGNRNYAVAAGVVEAAGWLGDRCGNGVQIKHTERLKTLHCHNASLLVKKDDRVARGQAVGMTGATGRVVPATAVHTHLEVMVDGKEIDPQTMLPPKCVSGPKARTRPTLVAQK